MSNWVFTEWTFQIKCLHPTHWLLADFQGVDNIRVNIIFISFLNWSTSLTTTNLKKKMQSVTQSDIVRCSGFISIFSLVYLTEVVWSISFSIIYEETRDARKGSLENVICDICHLHRALQVEDCHRHETRQYLLHFLEGKELDRWTSSEHTPRYLTKYYHI